MDTTIDSSIVLNVAGYGITLKTVKYTAFLLSGIASLWPWNCFLSASDYFQDKFTAMPALSDNYSSAMMAVSTGTSTLFNFYLSQMQSGVNYADRLKFGNYLQMVVFFFMTISVIIVPDSWTIFYFTFVMANVLITSIGSCLTQVGMMALVNMQKSSIYANATVVGNAVAGVLPSIAMIIAVISNTNAKISPDVVEKIDRSPEAVKYFITSILIAILAQASIFTMEYFERKASYETASSEIFAESTDQLTEGERDSVSESNNTSGDYVGFKQLWSKLKYVESTIILTFSLTLIFPVFASTVESSTFNIPKKVFVPLAFLLWNIGDLVGRLLCASPIFVIKRNRILISYSIARILFVPLFLMCNIKNRGGVIGDFGYLLIQLFFGITNGQLFSASYMRVGELLDLAAEKKAAAAFTALLINGSLLLGSLASFAVVYWIS